MMKEDEVINRYDLAKFYNYLNLRYWPTEWNDDELIDQFPDSNLNVNIQVSLAYISKPNGVGYFPPITMVFSGNGEKLLDVILSSKLINKYPDTEKILGNEYKFEYPQQNFRQPHIVKNNGQMTNMDCVKIIDTILNMVDKPLYFIKETFNLQKKQNNYDPSQISSD